MHTNLRLALPLIIQLLVMYKHIKHCRIGLIEMVKRIAIQLQDI